MKEEEISIELYLKHNIISREFRENLIEHLKNNKELDIKKFQKEFDNEKKINISENSNILEAYELVYDATEYLNRKMDDPGLELLDKALELDPENEQALDIKMDVIQSHNKPDDAEKIADKLINMKFLNTEIYVNAYKIKSCVLLTKGFETKNKNLLIKSLDCCNKGLKIESDDYDLTIQKAGILFQLGRKEFNEYLKKASKIDKKRTELFMKHYWIDEKII